MDRINEFIINPILYLLMAAAFIYFIWGVVKFIGSKDDSEGVSDGKKHILWGLVGLAIIISVFGIIRVIVNFITSFK